MKFTRWRMVRGQYDSAPAEPACKVIAPAQLGELDQAQLVASVGRGANDKFTAAEFFAPGFANRGGDCAWVATALETPTEWWDVEEGGVNRFQVWLYGADCGLVFEAGTTRAVAQAIQFGSAWERFDLEWEDEAFRCAFADAHREAAARNPASSLKDHYPIEGPPAAKPRSPTTKRPKTKPKKKAAKSKKGTAKPKMKIAKPKRKMAKPKRKMAKPKKKRS